MGAGSLGAVDASGECDWQPRLSRRTRVQSKLAATQLQGPEGNVPTFVRRAQRGKEFCGFKRVVPSAKNMKSTFLALKNAENSCEMLL
jgi:hypothetical protein